MIDVRATRANVTLPYTILLQKDETSETIQGVKRIINGDKLPSSSSSSSSKQKLIIIRQLEENDVPTAVRMTVKEYGSYPSSSSSPFEKQSTQKLLKHSNQSSYLFKNKLVCN